jgi:hypothetical protein
MTEGDTVSTKQKMKNQTKQQTKKITKAKRSRSSKEIWEV